MRFNLLSNTQLGQGGHALIWVELQLITVKEERIKELHSPQYTVEPNKKENKKTKLFLDSGITNGLFSAGVEKNSLINWLYRNFMEVLHLHPVLIIN
jgi:hypothetical protein